MTLVFSEQHLAWLHVIPFFRRCVCVKADTRLVHHAVPAEDCWYFMSVKLMLEMDYRGMAKQKKVGLLTTFFRKGG